MFLDDLNRRYAIAAAKSQDLHRDVEAGVSLEEILCVQEKRVVGKDWCVRWQNRWLQIGKEHALLRLSGRRVLIKELSGGNLIVEHQGQRLLVQELRARPPVAKACKVVVNNQRWKPGVDHPWKTDPVGRAVPRVSLASAAPTRDLHAEKRKAG